MWRRLAKLEWTALTFFWPFKVYWSLIGWLRADCRSAAAPTGRVWSCSVSRRRRRRHRHDAAALNWNTVKTRVNASGVTWESVCAFWRAKWRLFGFFLLSFFVLNVPSLPAIVWSESSRRRREALMWAVVVVVVYLFVFLHCRATCLRDPCSPRISAVCPKLRRDRPDVV